ncbi:MAG: prepilin-type N-terminal cleavage/methylation domain-containing protein [Acidobacteria bacterium]|nr:prepilin-type N-terminal cleavage/methylation domain-containing protein [Acidobacteriota bacterium]
MPVTAGRERGFSLMEIMIATLVASTMFAIALPSGKAALDSLELANGTREVERELQTARMRAVAANRPMRIKLNCPNNGQYRLVEVTGLASTDDAAGRCDESLYGYPGPRDNLRATPEHDGPLRHLDSSIAPLLGPELEFSPDGTTRMVVNGAVQTLTADGVISLERHGAKQEITVNALGRITLVQ